MYIWQWLVRVSREKIENYGCICCRQYLYVSTERDEDGELRQLKMGRLFPVKTRDELRGTKKRKGLEEFVQDGLSRNGFLLFSLVFTRHQKFSRTTAREKVCCQSIYVGCRILW